MDRMGEVLCAPVDEQLLPGCMVRGDNSAERRAMRLILRMAAREYLDEEQRALLRAVYLDGKTQTEVAGERGVHPSCVCKRLRGALDILRRHSQFCLEVYREICRRETA